MPFLFVLFVPRAAFRSSVEVLVGLVTPSPWLDPPFGRAEGRGPHPPGDRPRDRATAVSCVDISCVWGPYLCGLTVQEYSGR